MAKLADHLISEEIQRPGILADPVHQLRYWFREKDFRHDWSVPRQLALELFQKRWEQVPEMQNDNRARCRDTIGMQRPVRYFRIGMTKLNRANEIWQDIRDLIEQVVNHSIFTRSHVRKLPVFEVRWVPATDAYYVRLVTDFWKWRR